MEPWAWALAVGIVAIAYLVRGITGFGSALVAVPSLALLAPLSRVVPVIALLDHLAAWSQGYRYRRAVLWRELIPLLPFTLLGVLGGRWLIVQLDTEALTGALGVFVLAYAIYQLLPVPDLRAPRSVALPLGLLGGLIGTLFGTGGAFYVIYYQLRGLPKGAFRATISATLVIDSSLRVLAFISLGLFDREALLGVAVLLPVGVLGLYLGAHMHTRLSQATFLRMISVLLLVSGALLLTR